MRPAKLRFGWEPIKVLLAEPNVRDLIVAYYEELSPLKGIAKLDPNWEGMVQAEKDGVFCVWTARVDQTLAGFITFHLLYHMHYRNTLFAQDAGHFLAPLFRDKGRIGYRMWKTVEPALRVRGAKIIMAHDNAYRPLMPFFLALDYEPRSTMFWKAL
jgi:hypothetical protein